MAEDKKSAKPTEGKMPSRSASSNDVGGEKPMAETSTEKKTTGGGSKPFIFGIGGIVIVVIVLCFCCCIGIWAIAKTDSFQEGYCESFLENNKAEDDPLDICDEYVEKQLDKKLNDLNKLFDNNYNY